MTRTFYTWPHTARKIVEESLREFVGDGEGEDYEVLTTFINEVQAEAVQEVIDFLDSQQGNAETVGYAHLAARTIQWWQDARADRLKKGADRG